jgi:hypothetical protein
LLEEAAAHPLFYRDKIALRFRDNQTGRCGPRHEVIGFIRSARWVCAQSASRPPP